ncbi:AAA family ATPase, partial [Enterocloster citroniae]|nr:cytidylate kinase-like family protein [Enterocloster citroniae]
MRKTVITISRQYGSGGGEIGEQLSGNLGIPLYDKQLFMEAACQSGIHRDFFENAEKRGQDRFSYMYG